jgi:hypothetical protein
VRPRFCFRKFWTDRKNITSRASIHTVLLSTLEDLYGYRLLNGYPWVSSSSTRWMNSACHILQPPAVFRIKTSLHTHNNEYKLPNVVTLNPYLPNIQSRTSSSRLSIHLSFVLLFARPQFSHPTNNQEPIPPTYPSKFHTLERHSIPKPNTNRHTTYKKASYMHNSPYLFVADRSQIRTRHSVRRQHHRWHWYR